MSIWLLGTTAAIYIGVAIDYWSQHRYGMSLAFVAYATANVGFMLDSKGF